jgi:hypothetical protein
LYFSGIWLVPEDWFRSCLTNRTQKVEVKYLILLYLFLWLGCIEVPQGWILGFLFIIYINDLPLSVKFVSEPLLFVDTSVIISSRNYESFTLVTNVVLSHLIKWFVAYKLVRNLDKANTVHSESHCVLRLWFRPVSTFVDITFNTFYKCTATSGTQIWRKCLRIKLNGFRPV